MASGASAQPGRNDRRHQEEWDDQRNEGQRDRDCILYCSAFRRLAGVTQVVSPHEGQVFHNRLTHTLEVAQLGRRLAEYFLAKRPELREEHGLDTEVVEAACLAHDLGHPPYGHVTEETLGDLLQPKGSCFEGNAQSFRIVARLAIRSDPDDGGFAGLNLTRATLNAILKYPWQRTGQHAGKKKWGAYDEESEDFTHAREDCVLDLPSLEARLMTLADDIAYSVHDLEDFYRAGLIPLERLESNQGDEQDRFLEEVFGRLEPGHSLVLRRTEAEEAFRQFCKLIPVDAPYEGNESDRARLRSFTSGRIKDYVMNSLPNGDPSADLTKAHPSYLEIEMAKQLTWRYVITSPALAAQHCGQRRIVRELFDTLADAVSRERKAWRILPARHREQMERLGESASEADRLRLVADVIAGMTDTEAQQVYLRFTGHSPGSAFDPIVV